MRCEPRSLDVLPQAAGNDDQHLVVQLPAVHLFEAEELSDLEVDHAQVRDPLVRALGVVERVDRQAGHAVVDDAVAAQPRNRLRRRVRLRGRRGPHQADRRGRSSGFHRPSVLGLSFRSDRTLARSSSAPKGFAS